MHIGIDFDNTIVSYDSVFHRVATERGLVPPGVAPTKLEVRNWLRAAGQEDVWTELQGYVYGARMSDADAYPGAIAFFRWARKTGVPVSIISHRTREPFLGPRYDLHEAARTWVKTFLCDGAPLVPPERVHFETTKETKLRRIGEAVVTHFIDDLPEILLADSFPTGVEPILFDPDGHHVDAGSALFRARSWDEIHQYVAAGWKAAF